MTVSATVRSPTSRQLALAELGAELTPAKSLARLDAATARVVTTVGIVGTLLMGFGLLSAGLPGTEGIARTLAVASVVLAFLAVLCALSAQILTVTRGLNTDNLTEVETWYRRRFEVRAPLTSAAGVFLALAAATAGAGAVLAITGADPQPATISVTRTAELAQPSATASPAPAAPATDVVVVDLTFRNVDAGQVVAVTVTADGRVVAQAAIAPAADGTATRTVTVEHLPATAAVTVSAYAGTTHCKAESRPGQPLQVTCAAA